MMGFERTGHCMVVVVVVGQVGQQHTHWTGQEEGDCLAGVAAFPSAPLPPHLPDLLPTNVSSLRNIPTRKEQELQVMHTYSSPLHASCLVCTFLSFMLCLHTPMAFWKNSCLPFHFCCLQSLVAGMPSARAHAAAFWLNPSLNIHFDSIFCICIIVLSLLSVLLCYFCLSFCLSFFCHFAFSWCFCLSLRMTYHCGHGQAWRLCLAGRHFCVALHLFPSPYHARCCLLAHPLHIGMTDRGTGDRTGRMGPPPQFGRHGWDVPPSLVLHSQTEQTWRLKENKEAEEQGQGRQVTVAVRQDWN